MGNPVLQFWVFHFMICRIQGNLKWSTDNKGKGYGRTSNGNVAQLYLMLVLVEAVKFM